MHPDRFGIERREQRAGHDVHFVRTLVAVSVPLGMASSLVEFDVLIQRAAIKDVGELRTATDREHRHLEAPCLTKQREFPLVAVRLDRTQVLVRVVSVTIGFDVGSPTEDETVETSQYALDGGG